MLVPKPPMPVGRRRAVAEMTVAWKQVAAIEPSHVFEIEGDARDAGLPAVLARDSGLEPPIRFTVVYRMREYLALLHEHLPASMRKWELARGKRPRQELNWSSRVGIRLLLPLIGVPGFLLKKRRMPVCDFTIDAAGIERRTRDGTLHVAWTDVVQVHRYAQAYLVDKGSGGLPLPYRCLDAAQRAAFERLLSRFGHDTPV